MQNPLQNRLPAPSVDQHLLKGKHKEQNKHKASL